VEGRNAGPVIVAIGVAIVVVGVLVTRGWLSWFGRLPGDIRIESESTRVYVPLTSMLLVSLALTLVINLFRRL
jgi:di/tricarboxylate transporter